MRGGEGRAGKEGRAKPGMERRGRLREQLGFPKGRVWGHGLGSRETLGSASREGPGLGWAWGGAELEG